MNEDVFNGSIRKFLKAARGERPGEIKRRSARVWRRASSRATKSLPPRATVTLGGIGFSHAITGEIELEWSGAKSKWHSHPRSGANQSTVTRPRLIGPATSRSRT